MNGTYEERIKASLYAHPWQTHESMARRMPDIPPMQFYYITNAMYLRGTLVHREYPNLLLSALKDKSWRPTKLK